MKKIAFIILLSLCLMGFGACSNDEVENTTSAAESETVLETILETGHVEEPTDESAEETMVTETTGMTEPLVVTDPLVYELSSPDIVTLSATEKEVYFYRDGLRIAGMMYLPEGDGPFPVVIMVAGFGMPQEFCPHEMLVNSGFAVVTFDPIGVVPGSHSDGGTRDMSVLTEAADLNAVVDCVYDMPEIDCNNIFLWGHSLGGFVVTYCAATRPFMINSAIVLEPSYQFSNEAYVYATTGEGSMFSFYGERFSIDAASFDIFDVIPSYTGSILIIGGGVSPSVAVDYAEFMDAGVALFPNAEYISIPGANHNFDGGYMDVAMGYTVDFINSHIVVE